MKLTRSTQLALALALLANQAAPLAAQGLGPPIIDYLEFYELTPHQRVSIHGINFEQSGQVHIGGIPAMVVPIPGTNPVKMNAYIPAEVPYGTHDVTVTTSVGTSNAFSLEVVPREPKGRELWRFFMNNQVMIHRPALAEDGTIYARSQAGDLIAITPQGEMKWFLQLPGDLQPTIDIGPDGTIYTADAHPTVYAVDPDGTIRWTYSDPISSQGVVAGPNVGPDGNIYVVTHTAGTGIFSLDPAGNLRWAGPDNPYFPIGQEGQEIVFSESQLFFCQNGYFDSFDFDGTHVFREFTVTSSSDDSPQPAVGPSGDCYVEQWGQLRSHAPDGSLNWMELGVGGSWLSHPDVGPDGTIYLLRNVFNTFHALNPDGSTKWTYNHPFTLKHPVMDPTGETILVGGGEYGNAFYLALDEGGDPLWQVDLPLEPITPWETAQAFPQGRARFTPDGSVAYVMASGPSDSGGHSYLYAIQVGPSVDVGHGMQGSVGAPTLSTQGTLAPGAPLTVTLEHAAPGASAVLVAGWQAQAQPFLGGVLLPATDIVLAQQTDPTGRIQFTFHWPALAPETQLLAQYWIADPAGPGGWVASNAVSLITP